MVFFLVFLFGLCVGSFLNVLIYRLHLYSSTSEEPLRVTIRGVLGGRSFCDHCRHKLAWQDNIPLLSFIFLRGRCRNCHSPISIQYPLVELATGILFVFIFQNVTMGQCGNVTMLSCFMVSLFHGFIVATLIVIFVSDLRYQIIPDQIVYPVILITLFYQIIFNTSEYEKYLVSGILAAGFFYLLFLVTHGRGMGLGDVKLAALMGLFLGSPKIIVALYLAFLTGALVGVILVLIGKKRFGEHIPFGPFLTGATILSLFFGEVIWQKLIAVLL